jgi:6-phosphogluconolactonase
MKRHVIVLPDKGALGLKAASVFAELSRESTANGRIFRVALSGGTTPRRLYELLASDPYRGKIDWPRVEVFFADERCVPPGHEDSNFKAANDALLRKVPAVVHRIRGEIPPEEAAREYERELRAAFKVKEADSFLRGDAPSFDLVLLGLGEDGHTASLFPGTDVFGEKDLLAAAVYVASIGTWRVTLTLPVINRARHVTFLAAGRAKAGVVREIIKEGAGEYPAGLVLPLMGEVTWLLDEEAAFGL